MRRLTGGCPSKSSWLQPGKWGKVLLIHLCEHKELYNGWGAVSNSEFPTFRRSLTVAITLIWLFLALGHDTRQNRRANLLDGTQSPMFHMQHNGHRLVDYCMDVSRWLGVDVDDRKVAPRRTRKSVRSLSNAPRTNFSRNAPMQRALQWKFRRRQL
jgi:hypothetical protein